MLGWIPQFPVGQETMQFPKPKNSWVLIVDEIHYYVNNGGTIVDFCCGANDFSQLMKEKLECMGKNCFYKNYDLHPAKNDFNFEIRDWFTVALNELPSGSRLSFYLPGSVDVNGKQIDDWNKALPVLYLWSRADWTARHKAMAEKVGQLQAETE
ncbi:hypothetical protein Cgig2_023467 [Carnegiea gigantea]|uniref:DM2 domain-containing protein n=1 Tax=Carnegiea gigantea TaxID=171969 RepID=A0A9Q1K658_9CARY|nr:hypothetical protein Cgig2_023467 [Carnegiea gigantea]